MGGSSYIDSVLLRDRDINTAWRSASDGTLETRHLFCQNWRADVSAVLNSNGTLTEWVKYRAYGAPFSMPVGDTDSDGDKDATDEGIVFAWSSGYDVRADLDLDGDVDMNDYWIASLVSNSSQGYAAMSSADVENRKGYAGYENSYEILRFNHVRHRVMDTELGRWTRRDPMGYVDGASLVAMASGMPITALDSSGLLSLRGVGNIDPCTADCQRYDFTTDLPTFDGVWTSGDCSGFQCRLAIESIKINIQDDLARECVEEARAACFPQLCRNPLQCYCKPFSPLVEVGQCPTITCRKSAFRLAYFYFRACGKNCKVGGTYTVNITGKLYGGRCRSRPQPIALPGDTSPIDKTIPAPMPEPAF
jgi:RHS repeat-associated protein